MKLAPVLFVVLLLVLATVFDGAFAVRNWAPPAIFALAVLGVAAVSGGGARIGRTPLALALGAAWALAGWAVLSAVWAESAASAVEGGARLVLYAALLSIPAVALRDRRALEVAGYGAVAGIAVIAVITLLRLLVEGGELFLAGRLDAPVGYRNATACLFALAFWPLVGVMAAREPARFLRGVTFALAVLCLGLAWLTQSRGIALGLAAGAVVALALGPDRVRRAWTAALALAGVALASPSLLTAYEAFDAGRGVVRSADVVDSATALLALTAAAFAAGLLLAIFDKGLRPQETSMGAVRVLARAALVIGAFAVVAGGLVAVGDPVSFARDKWQEFRANETVADGGTRLTTAGGQRYDLWRVALDEFASAPVHGVGQSNYRFDYFRERTTDRNLDNPHSFVFSVMSELGLVGLALLAAFLAALVWTVASGWRTLDRGDRRLASGLLAAAAVLFGQLLVDWVDLIPGVMGLALFCLGAGVTVVARGARSAKAAAGAEDGGRALPLVRRLAYGVPLLVLAVVVAALYLSDAYVRQARAEIPASPQRQLDAARTAAALNPFTVEPLYLEAGALESLGRLGEARRTLLEALDAEPRNVATLGLLGDFAVRHGRPAEAREWYRRALRENPKDVGLQKLARSGGRR